MTTPVSAVPIQQPIGAYSLNGSKDLKAGHFVVNPPTIRPYSFYDKIKVDPQFYNELINPKSKAFYHKPTVRKSKLKGILQTTAFVGGIVLAFAYRKNIQKFVIESFNKIKNMVKR